MEARERLTHSLHAYFLLPGDPKVPIIYEVDRIRDGGSFTTRRVIAIQHGQAIFSMAASFHKPEPGFDHQIPMPDVPPPEELPSEEELRARFLPHLPEEMRHYWEFERPIELRPVDLSRFLSPGNAEPRQNIWIRASGPLPDDARLHHCVLAYASDFSLLDTSLVAHGRLMYEPRIQDGKPRPRRVVSPALPRRRVGALLAGQPERDGRTRVLPGQHLFARRELDCVGRAGGVDPGAGGEINADCACTRRLCGAARRGRRPAKFDANFMMFSRHLCATQEQHMFRFGLHSYVASVLACNGACAFRLRTGGAHRA